MTTSANATTIPGSDVIVDANGAIWTLRLGDRVALKDGVATGLGNVLQLWYLDGSVWAFTGVSWQQYVTPAWAPPTAQPNIPTTAGLRLPVGPQTLASYAGVQISAGAAIQPIVDANPAGTTYVLAIGTYSQQSIVPKNGDQFIGLFDGTNGAALDGAGVTAHAFTGVANYVVIKNLIVKNYSAPTQFGMIQIFGQYALIQNNEITGATQGAGVWAGGHALVIANYIHGNAQEGYKVVYDDQGSQPAVGTLFDSNEIANNNPTNAIWNGSEQGGGKIWATQHFTSWYNYIHDNGGSALWTDFENINTTHWANKIGGVGMGIEHEISYSARFMWNEIDRVNWPASTGWFFANAAINIENSGGSSGGGIAGDEPGIVEVAYNTIRVAPGARGIVGRQQARGSSTNYSPGVPRPLRNINVHHNTVDWSAVTVPLGDGIVGFVQDTGDATIWNNASNGIVFDHNTYIAPPSNPYQFVWGDANGWSFAQWQGFGHDQNGVFKTTSPDGTSITAPTTSTLTTIDGTWSFGGAASTWGSDILLNGAGPKGQAVTLRVDRGGQMFAQNSAGTWFVYQNGAFVASAGPGFAGTYGDATHVAKITVDVDGHITAISSVPIAFPPGTTAPVGTPVVGSNAGIMWGVNIHAGRGGVYSTLGGNATMALVASLGLKIVRTDLYTASAQDQAILTAALASAATAGTKVMPILMADINPAITSYADETAAYNAGHAMGLTYGTNFKGQVSVWEVGNEWNGKFGAVANAGALATDYDATNLAKVRGLARGLIEGLKAGDPAAKVAFGSTSALSHWGWTDALYAAGVRWDITSVHYYDNGTFDITALPLAVGTTDLLALMHSKYNVPNWITEWNYYPPGTAQATEAAYLTSTMAVWDSLAGSKFLEGVFLYELLEEGDGFGIASGAGGLLPESTAIKTYLAAHPSIINSVATPAAAAPQDFTAAVQAAWSADTCLNWQGGDVTLTAPVNLVADTSKFGWKLHLNGATITSDFNDATKHAINIIVPVVAGVTKPNINVRNWEVTGGTFKGRSPFKGALYAQCWTNQSWIYGFKFQDIGCEGHSGHAIHASGSVFEFTGRDIISTGGLGLFRATERGMVENDPTAADGDRGLPSAMELYGVRCRDFNGDAILLDSSTPYREPFDLITKGGYIVTGLGSGVGIKAPAGLNIVEGVGFEYLNGGAAISLGYRGGLIKACRAANPIAGATISPPKGLAYLVDCYLSGGSLVFEDCAVQNENAGTGIKLARVNGSGSVYLNRSGTAVDGTGPTVKVAQYA